MKPFLYLALTAVFAATLLAFGYRHARIPTQPTRNVDYANRTVVRCTPDWDKLKPILAVTDIPPIPGAGSYSWKISTAKDSAQFYFNQGINMYYSFHIIESMASFQKAARFDPGCAMLYWAQALAYGPNINDVGYAASPEALAATAEAVRLRNSATPREQLLIDAMDLRYAADNTLSREQLNQLYTEQMRRAYEQFPDDADIAALYADAMMLQHPWDLWHNNGTPQPWTPVIRTVLEKLLAKTPGHPGANHYYIHVMEPSPYPEKAIPSANRLGKLTPGLAHTVHMPSHIYLRTGDYEKGVLVNEDAVQSYQKIIPVFSPVTGNDFLYIIHNLHMQTNHAMIAGREAYAVQSARATQESVPEDYLASPGALGNYLQYIYMSPVLNDIRFGRWQALLQHPEPSTSYVYASLLYHFGRGMAFAGLNNMDAAGKELDQLRHFMADSELLIPLEPFSPAIDGARIAEQLLLGAIHERRQLIEGAVRHYAQADSIEQQMVYNEPRDWLLSPRLYLGNVLLQSGDGAGAAVVFRRDLQVNNENGWALLGLGMALELQEKKEESAAMKQRAARAFRLADKKITRPAY